MDVFGGFCVKIGVLCGGETKTVISRLKRIRADGAEIFDAVRTDGVYFDVLIIGSPGNAPKRAMSAGTVVISADAQKIRPVIKNCETAVTYGLNGRASVTVSAVTDERLTVCLTREIHAVTGERAAAQEFSLLREPGESIESALAAAAGAVACGWLPRAGSGRL